MWFQQPSISVAKRWHITQPFACFEPKWQLRHPLVLLTHLGAPLFYFCLYHWSDLKVRLTKCSKYLLAFLKDVSPLSIAFMASSSCWYIHLPHLDAFGYLLVLAKFCIVVVVGWHYYVIGCKCWFTCVVKVVGWGCQFFWSSQSILETPLHCFLHTLRCVGRQSTNGAPLVCGYKASFA